MAPQKRYARFGIPLSPEYMKQYMNEDGAWHETQQEVEQQLAWGEEKAALLRWVRGQMKRRLTSRERRCIEMYYFQDLTYREMAARLGVSPSSAHRAVRRGLRRLRQAVQEGRPPRCGRR